MRPRGAWQLLVEGAGKCLRLCTQKNTFASPTADYRKQRLLTFSEAALLLATPDSHVCHGTRMLWLCLSVTTSSIEKNLPAPLDWLRWHKLKTFTCC